jgi:hypothetical protein
MAIICFRGEVIIAGAARPLSVSISAPVFDPRDYGSFFCEVMIPPVLTTAKRIFGEDAEQALELARLYVVRILQEYRVRDSEGKDVIVSVASLQFA